MTPTSSLARLLPLLPLLAALLAAAAALAGEPNRPLGQARSLLDQGLEAEAVEPMRQAARLAPDDVAVQREYLDLLKAQGRGRELLAEFSARREAHPDDANAQYLYGVASGDPKTARAAFDEALRLDPKHKWARQGLGSVDVAEGKLEAALVHYRRALELDPAFAEVHNKVANVHLALGQRDQAHAAWQAAIAAAPNDHHAYMNRGAVLSMDGDLDGAAAMLEQAVRTAPGRPRVHFNYGYVLFKLQRHDDALAHFAVALAINPRDRTVRGTRDLVEGVRDGRVPFAAAGPYEEAMSLLTVDPTRSAQKYRELLLLAPDFALAHRNLGVALLASGEAEEALVALERGAELDPDEASVHHNLGNLHLATGRLDEALVAFSRAHELDPGDADSLAALATVQLNLGRHDDALRSFTRALSLRPRDPALLVARSAAQTARGDLEGAILGLRESLELAPEFVAARVQLVAVLREARRFDEALAELDEIERYVPGHPDVASERASLEGHKSADREAARGGKLQLSRIVVADAELARGLVERARGGEDFARLASRYGGGPEANRGGDIGFVDPGELREELQGAVAGLAVGDVSDAVQLGTSWIVLRRTR